MSYIHEWFENIVWNCTWIFSDFAAYIFKFLHASNKIRFTENMENRKKS